MPIHSHPGQPKKDPGKKVVSIGVSIPPALLVHVDSVVEDQGYRSRSALIADTIKALVGDRKAIELTGSASRYACELDLVLGWRKKFE